MKRTGASTLVALTLVGLVIGFLVDVTAAATGVPIFVPPISLPVTLVAIAGLVVALAWPIRQATKGTGTAPVNPFVAMRVAVLAKSSSLSGALLLGGGMGILLFILTRSVFPAVTSVWLAVATVAGAALLLAGGLVAEHFCTLPPDDHEDERGEAHV
jgi:Protein of unknown function (DUF3180)